MSGDALEACFRVAVVATPGPVHPAIALREERLRGQVLGVWILAVLPEADGTVAAPRRALLQVQV